MKIKKSIYILLIIISWSDLKAQDVDFGFKGGLNYAKTLVPGDDAFMARTSFHAGIFAEIPLKGKWSFHPEIMYSSQGSRFDLSRIQSFNDPFFNNNEDIIVDKANFLLIPLITKFNFNELISLEVGPQVGFLVSEGSYIDYGPTLGVGFDIQDKFKIQLRSYLGISDVFRKSIIENEKLGDKTYFALLQLSVGYVFF